MKVLKHYAMALAVALAAALGPIGTATASAMELVVTTASSNYVEASAKLSAELAYHASSPAVVSAQVSADLVRDGHGYRQFSALALDLTSPELSV